MSVTVKIYFDTRNEIRKKSKDYPYKLQVYSSDPKGLKHYPTIYGATEDEDDKLTGKRLSEKLQTLKTNLKDVERAAADVIKEMDPFSFDDFVRDFIKDNPHFDQTRVKLKASVIKSEKDFDFTEYHKRFPILLDTFEPGTIGAVYQIVIKKKIAWGKVKTAISYHNSFNSLRGYGGNVRFKEITDTYLKFYSDWMKNGGLGRKRENTKTSVGIYLRALRHVFNVAINELKIIKREKCYPFGKTKYRIPKGRNIKKAFEADAIRQLYYHQPTKPWYKKAKAFWFFIFFGNGMNPLDICNLKYKDIVGDLIIFERAKTEDTLEDPPKIIVVINEDIQATIDEYGNEDKSPDNYIFPMFKPGMSILERINANQNFVNWLNVRMRSILSQLDIDATKAGAYEARHSAATAQIAGGATLLEVQEMLGQIDPKTTKRYIDSLPITVKKTGAARMEAFKKSVQDKEAL